MARLGQAAIGITALPNIGINSKHLEFFYQRNLCENLLTNCFYCIHPFWHASCKVVFIAGMVRNLQKEINMTQYARTQILSAFAAVICAFITIGISVAPAIAPVSGLVA